MAKQNQKITPCVGAEEHRGESRHHTWKKRVWKTRERMEQGLQIHVQNAQTVQIDIS